MEAHSDKYAMTDEHGVMRVTGTHVMLDSVVIAFLQGDSAEAIQRQYPSLTLEQAYGAIAYYLRHREQVDEYLRRQDELWAKLRAESAGNPSPVVERLRAMRGAGAGRVS